MEFGYWDENFTRWDIFRDNGIRNNAQADLFFGFDRIETVSSRLFIDPPFEEKTMEIRGDRASS